MNSIKPEDGLEMSYMPVTRSTSLNSVIRNDTHTLARLGKMPILKRQFGFMSILGFSCTALITWEGTLIGFQSGFYNGGPAGIVYGFILVWIGTLSVFTTLSELASMAPTSGGQYHWVAMLAPPQSQRFLSYLAGWFTMTGWQAAVASGTFLSASLLEALIIHTTPEYSYESYHACLIAWAVVLFCALINGGLSRLLPHFEGFTMILHVLGFFAIIIVLVILGPHTSASEVFGRFFNQGQWPTQTLSFFVGLLGNVFAFIGADGAIHMSEEIRNAELVVPRSIITSILLNGTMGFGMIIATLFCLGDIDSALNNEFPFTQVFLQATHSKGGSAVMIALIFVLALFATVALMASASRALWAFSRDNALPFSPWFAKIESHTSMPFNSIVFTATISCLLQLITIGSTVAFSNIVSLSVSGLFSSYLLCSGLLLYRRCSGAILQASDVREARTALVNTTNAPLVYGPWRIPGVIGVINNTFSCIYLTIVLLFAFFPPQTPVGPRDMNYCVLVTGAVTIFSVTYYLLCARKIYVGPVVEIRLVFNRMNGRLRFMKNTL